MSSAYKGRRPSLVRRFWIYRRVVALALLLGVILWFIAINNAEVTVYFPFRLGQITSTSGIVILLGFVAGAVAGALGCTVALALRRGRGTPTGGAGKGPADDGDPSAIPEDRPPSDYAAKTPEGFPESPWSGPGSRR